MTTQKLQVLIRRGTAAEWALSNPILLDGELGIDKTAGRFKLGDGVTAWSSLPYFATTVYLEDIAVNGAAENSGIFVQDSEYVPAAPTVGGPAANIGTAGVFAPRAYVGAEADYGSLSFAAGTIRLVTDYAFNRLGVALTDGVAVDEFTPIMLQGDPVSMDYLTQSGATTGQVATWNGSAWAPADAAGGSVIQIDVFEYAGSPHTWTKASGASRVRVICIGGGGGGCNGALEVSGFGGDGGGAGALADFEFPASACSATETVTIGAGGAGAPAKASGSFRAAGTAGGATTFGSLLRAPGGVSEINAGTTTRRGCMSGVFYAVGAPGEPGYHLPSTTPGSTVVAPTSGGGGSGTSGGVPGNGGIGAGITHSGQIFNGGGADITGGAGGVAPGGNGANGGSVGIFGLGGGGGAGAVSANSGAGGNGGLYGGGGGGGGACYPGYTGSKGGDGGHGVAIVIQYG